MRVQWMKIVTLSLFAPSVVMAQEKVERPTLKCQDPSCVHTVGSNGKNTDELNNPELRLTELRKNSYKRFRITGYRGVRATPYGMYFPATDELETKGVRVNATKAFNDWDPFDEGLSKNGGKYDWTVGSISLREVAPYGNLYTKGWFGSDDYDHLKFRIPPMKSTWERWNHWSKQNLPHRGEATLTHEITCNTMLKKIGGNWFQGGASGYIQPDVRNRNTIRNVEGRTPDGHATVNYKQEEETSVAFNIGGNAGFSAKNGAEGGVKIGFQGNFSSKNPFLFMNANSKADVNGKAESTASIESENQIKLFLFTNDMVSAWDIKVELQKQNLEIGSIKPVSSNKDEPYSNVPSSKTTTYPDGRFTSSKGTPRLYIQGNPYYASSGSPLKTYPGDPLSETEPTPDLYLSIEEKVTIKLEEWVKGYKSPQDAFRAADQNGDYKLHFDEIVQLLKEAKIKLLRKTIAENLLKRFGNGKNHITFPDLKNALLKDK
jgi:hypothetical protein